jgi:hypothetical protein
MHRAAVHSGGPWLRLSLSPALSRATKGRGGGGAAAARGRMADKKGDEYLFKVLVVGEVSHARR